MIAPRRRRLGSTVTLATLLLSVCAGRAGATEDLFKSQFITPCEYTKHIEGPAVDKDGVLYVVNFKTDGNIGLLRPGTSKSELFLRLPNGSIGNGIRFDKDGSMYVADFKGHNVLVLDHGKTKFRVYFHSKKFNQPNDLAMAGDGTLYLSDPNFLQKKGRIWRITRDAGGAVHGEVMSSREPMGLTNGIDLSPDEKTLYVSDSGAGKLLAFTIEGSRLIAGRPLVEFKGSELDGLRTDRTGRIFVTDQPHFRWSGWENRFRDAGGWMRN